MPEISKPTNKEAFTAFVKKNNLEVANLEAINVLLFEMSEEIAKLKRNQTTLSYVWTNAWNPVYRNLED